MARGDDNDERDATETAAAKTATLDDTVADQTPIDDTDEPPVTAPRTPVPPGSDDDADGSPTEVVGHRRKPGLWFPLIVFVLLLAAGAYVGRFVVPRTGPDPGAVPQASGGAQAGPDATGTADPTRPGLATAPVRQADELRPWASQVGPAADIPPVAVQAYGYAQLNLQRSDPGCHLGWTTLAGVGQIESQHGQIGGAVLQDSGRSAPLITGPAQDGKGGRAFVGDTDAGAFDGDVTYDRPMGPLRLMPSVWRSFAIDADGDGILDPFDIDDSALTLARLLCSGNEDLTQLSGWNAAIARHHTGSAYAKSVFTTADGYGQKTRSIG